MNQTGHYNNARIADYALLGDGHSAALVSRYGSVDWVCFPRFDSEAVFAKLLGTPEHGCWTLTPKKVIEVKRFYLDGTNILKTIFTCGSGTAELVDFMPCPDQKNSLYRWFKVTDGSVQIEHVLQPRGAFGKSTPHATKSTGQGCWFEWDDFGILLDAGPSFYMTDGSFVRETLTLGVGDELKLRLLYSEQGSSESKPKLLSIEDALEITENYWRSWSDKIAYEGPYEATVKRSALVLKALMYRPSGAILAAPTTSLPESLGGERNWDYRYSWLRDSVFTVAALTNVGHKDEAKVFFNWALRAVKSTPEGLAVGYDVLGEAPEGEKVLEHLPGYCNSRPVRCGNSGLSQFQLDVYGEFLSCLGHCLQHGIVTQDIDLDHLKALIEHLLNRCGEPDQGIWEMRSNPQHFVHSQAMAWLGVKKGYEAYTRLGGQGIDSKRVERALQDLHGRIFEQGVDSKRGCFKMSYSSSNLDAANLRLSLFGFIDPNHPIMRQTVDATMEHLCRNGLVARYQGEPDGLTDSEGAFFICGFWLVQNLAIQNRKQEAQRAFEGLVSYGNDLGLFSEEVDTSTGELLGNFPQAFTHIGLINAVLTLRDA